VPIVLKSGSLIFKESPGSVQGCKGIVFPLPLPTVVVGHTPEHYEIISVKCCTVGLRVLSLITSEIAGGQWHERTLFGEKKCKLVECKFPVET
jgi:hypothetical protein